MAREAVQWYYLAGKLLTTSANGAMEQREADLLRLLAKVYAAGLGEQPWSRALHAVATFFNAAGTVLFDLDRSNGRIPIILTEGVEQGQGEYVERMNAINPRVKFALTRSGCHILYDYEWLPEEAIRRHEFYAWLQRTRGLKYFIGSRMIDAGDFTTLCSVEFTPRQGHPEPDQIAMFRALAPHIANAWRVTRLRGQTAAAQAFSETLQQQARWGAIGLDRLGRIVSMNWQAQVAVARADGLVVQDARLRALRASEDRKLKLMLTHSLRAACGEGRFSGGVLAAPRRNGRQPYALRVLPVHYGKGPAPEHDPMVLVLVYDPVSRICARSSV